MCTGFAGFGFALHFFLFSVHRLYAGKNILYTGLASKFLLYSIRTVDARRTYKYKAGGVLLRTNVPIVDKTVDYRENKLAHEHSRKRLYHGLRVITSITVHYDSAPMVVAITVAPKPAWPPG